MLPGERALAEEYGVALGTIRRAIEELTARGLVIVLPGERDVRHAAGAAS